MPLTVANLNTLETYLAGVLNRSEHHARKVGAIALALVGAVLWRKDATAIKVRAYKGTPANILWFYVAGQKYALTYNHKKECIELRRRTQSGRTIASFDNSTPVSDVRRIFNAL